MADTSNDFNSNGVISWYLQQQSDDFLQDLCGREIHKKNGQKRDRNAQRHTTDIPQRHWYNSKLLHNIIHT